MQVHLRTKKKSARNLKICAHQEAVGCEQSNTAKDAKIQRESRWAVLLSHFQVIKYMHYHENFIFSKFYDCVIRKQCSQAFGNDFASDKWCSGFETNSFFSELRIHALYLNLGCGKSSSCGKPIAISDGGLASTIEGEKKPRNEAKLQPWD